MLVSTYSICACDLEERQWGVAVQSRFLGVGSIVPWAEPLVGAVATQSWANPRYGPEGLALLREGVEAADAVAQLTEADDERAQRELGIVDSAGRGATSAGEECKEWAGGQSARRYAAQGNILVSGETVDALAETFESTPGSRSRAAARLPRRRAGSGRRPARAAVGALLVVGPEQGYAGLSDVFVDLRVDDHERPLEELRRLFGSTRSSSAGRRGRGGWT